MPTPTLKLFLTLVFSSLLMLFLSACTGNLSPHPALRVHPRTENRSLSVAEKEPGTLPNLQKKSEPPPKKTEPPPKETERPHLSPAADPDLLFYSEYSERLGLLLDGSENKELLKAIEQWMGTPYQWGGCSEIGIDCSCLVKLIYEDVYGISLNRTSLFIYRYDLVPVAQDELREGDIIFFQIKRKPVSHMGIYLKNNRFVHASQSRGVTISDLNRRYFRKHFVFAGRPAREGSTASAQLALNDLVVVN